MKNIINSLSRISKTKSCILVLVIALTVRIFIIVFISTKSVSADETGYHQIAYNISEGNGYSLKAGEQYYFREPAYPVFLSLVFDISKLFGNKLEPLSFEINKKNDDKYAILNNAPEITIGRYLQAILDSFVCVLFFLMLSSILKQKYALLISILFSMYYSHAYNIVYLVREPLQTFFAILMCYSLMLYFNYNKLKYIVLTGLFWALLNLTFQVSIIFMVSIPVFIWIYKRNFVHAIKPSLILVLVMFLTASPWLIRTYSSFPDLRILKSFGTSLTPEYISYIGAAKKLTFYGLIDNDKENSLDGYFLGASEAQKFRVSWDGTLSRKTDSINSLIHEPLISKRSIVNTALSIKNCMPQTFAGPYITEKPLLAVMLFLPLLLLCLFAVIGIVKFFPDFFKINIIFITYLSVFFILATEKRRMFPIQPFVFLYGIMGILYFYYRYIKKNENKSIKEIFFIDEPSLKLSREKIIER